MIGLSNKPTDFLYQSAHHIALPVKRRKSGEDREREMRQMQAREADNEMNERDERSKKREY